MDYSSAYIQALSKVPGQVFAWYPSWIMFGITDTVRDAVIRAIPQQTGITEMIIASLIGGFAKTVDFVTWEQSKSLYGMKS